MASNNFCSNCGAKANAGAAFCSECGNSLGGGSIATGDWLRRFAPLIVFGILLAVGGLAIGIGYSNQPPPNEPLPGSASAAAPVPNQGVLPGDHPPIEIPANVRDIIERMEKVAESQPENTEAWKELGFVQYRASQVDKSYLDKAEASYRQVLANTPEDLDALRALGNIAYDRNDHGKATEYYGKYLELEPGDKSVRTDLGTMLLSGGQPDAAIQVYQSVLQEDPTFFQAQFNLAIAYRAAGKADLALAAMQRASEIAPDDASKQQVAAVLSRVGGASAEQPGKPSGTLQTSVEAVFRSHPIVGPRIDKIEWNSERAASVVLREFPMAGMPPMVREKFVSRLKSGIGDSKKRFDASEPIEIQLVDAASGEVMLEVVE